MGGIMLHGVKYHVKRFNFTNVREIHIIYTYTHIGERFMQVTSKMVSEKTTPQLQVGGACTSVAVAMGGVEGRYPEALDSWSRRERRLRQSIEWQSFQMNSKQVISLFPPHSPSALTLFFLFCPFSLSLSSPSPFALFLSLFLFSPLLSLFPLSLISSVSVLLLFNITSHTYVYISFNLRDSVSLHYIIIIALGVQNTFISLYA